MFSGFSGFVGRDYELAAFSAALEGVFAGRGELLLLSGEPGIGKTRTARMFADIAMRRDALVLWGSCNEQPGAPAYWPWLQIL